MQVFGKYRVLEQIAQGGMGTLLRAHDSVLDRTVALKLLGGHGPTTDDVRARFFREARAGARLTHPNIVTVHDLGEVDGQLFIVMEFLDGEDLGRLIGERRRLTLEARLDVMIQVCNGLAYAHRNGVVHRDLKPANILVTRTGQVKIVDFGIARLTRDETGLTQTGVMMGTLRYMAPEQGRGRADERSDIFSIGAVFHELLTLQPAFPGGDGMEILEALRTHEPPPVNRLDPSIPPDLAALVTDMLCKDPADRPASVEQVGARLRDIRQRLAERRGSVLADDTVSIGQVTGDPRRLGPSHQRARAGVLWAGVTAGVLAVGVGAYWLWPASPGSQESRVAAVTARPSADARPTPPIVPPPAVVPPDPPPPVVVPRGQPPPAAVVPRDPAPPFTVAPRGQPPRTALVPRDPAPTTPAVSPPSAPEGPRGVDGGSPPGERESRMAVATPTPSRPVDPPTAARRPTPAAPSSVSPPPAEDAPRTVPNPESRTEPVHPPAGAGAPPVQPPVVTATPPDPPPAKPAVDPVRDPAVAAVAGTWKGLMSTRLSEAAVELSVAPDGGGATAALLIHSARHLGAGTIGFHESYAIARHAWPKPLSRLQVDGRRLQGQDADALFALDLELSRDRQNLEGTLTAEGTVYSVHLRRR